MLTELHGGCLAPVAGFGRVEDRRLILTGRVLSYDGTKLLEGTWDDALDSETAAGLSVAAGLGRRAAAALLAEGAGELIAAARAFLGLA